jgi:pseudouridine synthase
MDTRINKFVAQTTGLSRRRADILIARSSVTINGRVAKTGEKVNNQDIVRLNGQLLKLQANLLVMLNKPTGYICSRVSQGAPTVYKLLPTKYADLKLVGRLDKDSSGLLLLTNDGNLALQLTHPRYCKIKSYLVELDKPLMPGDEKHILKGIKLEDGLSKLELKRLNNKLWQVSMREGRNRQIRRTFDFLGYKVITLHRQTIGKYNLGNLEVGHYKVIANK